MAKKQPQEVQDEFQRPEMTEQELREAGHLPTIFYKCPGAHWRKGGTFDYVGVDSVERAKELIDKGWFPTLDEAIADHDGTQA